jgi:chromosome segregation ATPase
MLQETEMREFFNRVLGDWSGLTEAANKVEGLSQRIDELKARVDALTEENGNLKSEVRQAWEYARTVEERANSLQSDLSNSQAASKALQETIVASDSRVAELTRNYDLQTHTLDDTLRERDEARSSVKDYEVLTSDLRSQLEEMTGERDRLQRTVNEQEKTMAALNETVSRVQSILNPPSNVEPFPHANVG